MEINAGYGIDNPFAKEIQAAISSQSAPLYTGLARNRSFYSNAIYSAERVPAVLFGVQAAVDQLQHGPYLFQRQYWHWRGVQILMFGSRFQTTACIGAAGCMRRAAERAGGGCACATG